LISGFAHVQNLGDGLLAAFRGGFLVLAHRVCEGGQILSESGVDLLELTFGQLHAGSVDELGNGRSVQIRESLDDLGEPNVHPALLSFRTRQTLTQKSRLHSRLDPTTHGVL
jgi:hypothetical protein